MDCPKDITPPYEWNLQEKLDPSYVEHLASFKLEARASGKKKVQDGAKKKGKGRILDSNFEGEDSRVLEHYEDKEREDILPFESLVDVQVKQLDMFCNEDVGYEGFQGTPFQQYHNQSLGVDVSHRSCKQPPPPPISREFVEQCEDLQHVLAFLPSV